MQFERACEKAISRCWNSPRPAVVLARAKLEDLAPLGQQQIAASSDRYLRYLGKTLQEPGQRDFRYDPPRHPGDRTLTAQRAHVKNQAITFPSFLLT